MESIGREATCFYEGKSPRGTYSLKIAVPVTLKNHNFMVGDTVVNYAFVNGNELKNLQMEPNEAGIKEHLKILWPQQKY